MTNLSWAHSASSTMIATKHSFSKHIHSRDLPILRFVLGIKTRNVMQKTMSVLKVVQPLATPITVFTIKIDRAKEPRSRLSHSLCPNLPASRVFPLGLQQLKIPARSQNLQPVFIDHRVPSQIAMEPNGAMANKYNAGALLTAIRMPEETQLISNTTRPRFARSLKVPEKMV